MAQDTTTALGRGELGITAADGYYVGSGPEVGGYIRPPSPEHHCPIYCDSSDIVAVSGGGAAASSAGHT